VKPADIALLVGLCLFNTALLIGLLLRASRPIDLPRLVRAASLVALVSLLEVALFWRHALSWAGAVHLAWLDLVFVLPSAAIAVLAVRRDRREVSRGARRAAWLALVALPLGAWARYVEPHRLQVEHATVPLAAARAGSSPVTVGVLSDLQMLRVGDYERLAVRTLMEHQPDLILLPGDVFGGTGAAFHEQLPDIRQLLSLLSAPGGVWIVPGDCDGHEGFDTLTLGTDARVLHDDEVYVQVRDRSIRLLGLEHFRQPGARLRAFEELPGQDDVRILLCHRPDVVEALRPDSRVDLVVAGHTHGGQVALPGFGPLYISSPLPLAVGAGGLHSLDGRRVYVSRGVGMEGGQAPRIRFLVPPEVSLLTLR